MTKMMNIQILSAINASATLNTDYVRLASNFMLNKRMRTYQSGLERFLLFPDQRVRP
jgi:hypothetical protein